jgi:hypothetical protein
MLKTNIRDSKASVELILSDQNDFCRIEYFGDLVRVIGRDNFIKLLTYRANHNGSFRVKIEVESISDESSEWNKDELRYE